MKFYDRAHEIDPLTRSTDMAAGGRGRMTALTGRRRIGKTSLCLKAMSNGPLIAKELIMLDAKAL